MAGFSSTVKPAKQFSSTVKPVIPKPANPFFAGATNGTWGPLSAPPPPAPPRLAPRPGPGAPGAAPGAAGQAAGTSGTQTPASSSGTPLDATALNNIATNTFKATNSINGLNTNIGNLQTNLASALAALAYQQPRDQLGLEQGANKNGALYSSVYNQNLGNLNHSYATRQSDLTTAEGQQEGGLRAQIAAILGGEPLYNQGQANESGQRAITAAQNNPATGQPVPSTAPPAAPAASRTIEDGGFGGSTIQDGGFGAKPKAIQSGGFRAAPNSKGAIALAKVLAKKR